MAATSNESSCSSKTSSHEMLGHGDLERCGTQGNTRSPPRSAIIVKWLPIRTTNWRYDTIKAIACLMTLLCIAQAIYIIRFRAGLVRIRNAPYDNVFYNDRWDSPSIWSDSHQSFLNNVNPVRVHSHNDYWRRIPLFEALGSGCISIEADVHLRGSELLIGHTARELNRNKTLRSMYLNPLQRMLEQQNDGLAPSSWRGLWNNAPHQTLVLLVDHKTNGAETFDALHTQLQPLRELDYLTYWNGTDRVMRPLTVVATGNAPFASVLALHDTHRDIFLDAPLERLPSANDDFSTVPYTYKYNQSNSYLASTQFTNGRFSSYRTQIENLTDFPAAYDIAATQAEQAQARGLITRYWDTPSEPQNLREIAWRFLGENDVGLLNMDDLGIVRDRPNAWGKI